MAISARSAEKECSYHSEGTPLDTRFQIASCAKPIAATVILHTIGSNPEQFSSQDIAQTKRLLSHTALLPGYTEDLSLFERGTAETAGRARQLIVSDYLESGDKTEDYGYSNLGYIYAAHELEKKFPLTYEHYLTQLLRESVAKDFNTGPQQRKYWFNTATGKVQTRAPLSLPGNMTPAGNLFLSATTLRRFGDRHIQCLHQKSECEFQLDIEEVHSATASGYGLGWRIQSINGHKVSQHLGKLSAARCLIAISPEQDRSLAVLIAEGDPNAIDFIRELSYGYF